MYRGQNLKATSESVREAVNWGLGRPVKAKCCRAEDRNRAQVEETLRRSYASRRDSGSGVLGWLSRAPRRDRVLAGTAEPAA